MLSQAVALSRQLLRVSWESELLVPLTPEHLRNCAIIYALTMRFCKREVLRVVQPTYSRLGPLILCHALSLETVFHNQGLETLSECVDELWELRN
ncbi:hypothetical protein RRG08_017397 [Elysia crispata]|uniref:Uncharacterized protein n=1 Tax=Elysia crispata TaxID=231223 RepID=A0AAE0Z6B6_9GAST|nr:hypothetical protein RRG08_017397 [Elysia crispata]